MPSAFPEAVLSAILAVSIVDDSTNNIAREVSCRRTFAIISHPDAGKTTLTEKILLFGGSVREAGAVRAQKARRHATSDWLEIERQRGISVSSSVLHANWQGNRINILDTPGHRDFSEDTYRTLIAADSAVMLIDSAKGVEGQTRKLFEVCRLRGIPIFTFINKMDRDGRDPFDLLSEIEDVLGIESMPLDWPIGSGREFRGVYDRIGSRVLLFSGGRHGTIEVDEDVITGGLDTPAVQRAMGSHAAQVVESLALLDGAGASFDPARVAAGLQTPVFLAVRSPISVCDLFSSASSNSHPARRRAGQAKTPSTRRAVPSRVSSSRFRQIWIPATATGSPSCAFARAASSPA